MSMSLFFEHQTSSFKRSYLRNLIKLASADGVLKDEERHLINSFGIRRGLKTWQIDELFQEELAHELFVPESIANRMNMLHDLMELVYVDRQASKGEMAVISDLLKAFHLDVRLLDTLIHLFHEGTPDPLDWRDFVGDVCCPSVAQSQQPHPFLP
jgi:uncharacterized tellurite resistance protein B-like protein